VSSGNLYVQVGRHRDNTNATPKTLKKPGYFQQTTLQNQSNTEDFDDINTSFQVVHWGCWDFEGARALGASTSEQC